MSPSLKLYNRSKATVKSCKTQIVNADDQDHKAALRLHLGTQQELIEIAEYHLDAKLKASQADTAAKAAARDGEDRRAKAAKASLLASEVRLGRTAQSASGNAVA